MDSVTQFVLGAAVGESIAGKKIGNRALLYGGIIGTIPDLDVAAGWFTDVVTANEIHRGFMHSLVFFILATPAIGFVLKYLERRNGLTWREAFHFAFWCLLTHSLLDIFTNWGTQLFWPLPHRIAIQSIFVIDPLYTLPLIICLVRLMFIDRSRALRRNWNIAGLAISSTYLLLTLLIQQYAIAVFDAAARDNGLKDYELSVRPAPLSTVLWNANIRADEGYYLADYSLLDTRPVALRYFPKMEHLNPQPGAAIIDRLKVLSGNWYTFSSSGGKTYFNDLRFGVIDASASEPEFIFSYELYRDDHLRARESVSRARSNPSKLLGQLWERIKGN